MKRLRTANKHHSYEARVGAFADYLLGKPWKIIEERWGINPSTISNWIRKTGHFKLRNEHKS